MRHKFFLLLLLLPFFSFATNIEATHTYTSSEDGTQFNVVSKLGNMGDVKFARITVSVSEGVKILDMESGKYPTEKTEEGFLLYLYQTPENSEIELSYTVSALSNGKITFSIDYSVDDERYFHDLGGISIDGEEVMINKGEETAVLSTNSTEKVSANRILSEGEVFTVQVLAVSSFDESALKSFCAQNNIHHKQLIQRNIGGMIKFSLGEYDNWDDAYKALNTFKSSTGLNDLFINKISR